MRAEAVHARPALGVGDQVDARAPAEAAALVVTGRCLHRDVEVELGQPAQLLGEHRGLPRPLRGQRHVRELSAAHAAGAGRRPRGLDAVRGRLEHLDGVGAPELRGLARVGQPRADALARQRVPDEDDAALVPGHAVTAVGDRADLELDEPAGDVVQGQ